MRQMAPDLLLHPVFDEAEALAGMPHREVIHPPPEHRIDQVYHPFNRLRPVSAEHLFERPHQRRPLFELGREGSMGCRNLTDAASPPRRGESDSTVTRAYRVTGEALLVPVRNHRSKVDRITG